jgi:hypothetical protein
MSEFEIVGIESNIVRTFGTKVVFVPVESTGKCQLVVYNTRSSPKATSEDTYFGQSLAHFDGA